MNGSLLGREPTLIIYAVLTALNTIQVAVIDMPAWAHTVIVIVTAVLAALVNRSQVTPVLKSADQPAGVGAPQP